MKDKSAWLCRIEKKKSKMALGWEEMRRAGDEKDDFCCGESRTRLLFMNSEVVVFLHHVFYGFMVGLELKSSWC